MQFGTVREANHVAQANEPLAGQRHSPLLPACSTSFAGLPELLAKPFLFKSKQLADIQATSSECKLLQN